MNTVHWLAVSVLLSPALLGDPGPEARAFLEVPDAAWSSTGEAQVFKTAVLPEGLQQIMTTAPGTSPATYSGYSLDLNNDKSPEYILQSHPDTPGGPQYVIYSKRDGEWTTIGDFQGGFHLLKPEHGWNRIIGYSQDGGDSHAMFRLDFRGDRYDEAWRAHFDAGQIIPPQSLFPHRAWCEDSRSPEERLQRLEGFWKEFLPQCDGGTNPDREEYEDAPHISQIRGAAYELALAHISAGHQNEARKFVEWLRWSDQLELWNDQPNPLTGRTVPLPEKPAADAEPSEHPQ